MHRYLRVGSLFSGYGGVELGLQSVLGGTIAWHCDTDLAAARVLAHHWPHTPNLGDITTVDWHQVEPVDVVTAGFPCQDISNAGTRTGTEGARSGLWTHLVDAVRALRPGLVVLENVAALLVRGIATVAADLATCGYDLRWLCLRASDVGAPHRRDRFFAVAHPQGHRHQRGRSPRHRGAGPAHRGDAAAHPHRPGPQEGDSPGGPDLSAWGHYAPAVDRWAGLLGRPAPPPTELGPAGGARLSPRAVEFLMGLPDGHVTTVAHLSRAQQLRLLGNGVVPQQAAAAIRQLTTGIRPD